MSIRLLVAVAASFAALATPAFGASARVEDGSLVYTAAPGEFNELNIMLQGGRMTIQDGTVGSAATLPVSVEPPCEPPNSGWVGDMLDAYCPADVERILVDVGDGADTVGIGAMTTTPYPTVIELGEGGDRVWGGPAADDIRGGDGDDTITGNAGRDVIGAGAGDDTIAAVDGFPDDIACGDGYDVVDADDVDFVTGCENIRSGSPQAGPATPQPVLAPQPVPVVRPTVAPAAGVAPPRIVDVISEWPTLAELARGGVVARVLCGEGCYVTSQLRLRSPAVRRGYRVLGAGRSERSEAGMVAVRTRLRPAATRRLRSLRRPRLVLRLEVTTGAKTTALSRRIALSASR
jgi:hemolysin type calcium-binding protein